MSIISSYRYYKMSKVMVNFFLSKGSNYLLLGGKKNAINYVLPYACIYGIKNRIPGFKV